MNVSHGVRFHVLIALGILALVVNPGLARATASFSLLTRQDIAVGFQYSIAIADFNHDGSADMAGVFSASSVSIFLGHGDGTFAAATTYPIGSSGNMSVATADLNGDGNADLLFCGSNLSLAVLLGNGDGTFQSPQLYAAGTTSVFVKTADLNGDGRPDALVSGGPAYVRLGNGDGTLGPRLDVSVTGCPSAEPMIGDFNGDGRTDLALANPCPFGKISVLFGNGDGTFQPQTDYPVPNLTKFGAAGDLNGDGRPDLAVVNESGTLSVLLNNGDGTFAPRTDTTLSSETEGVKIADFNADGLPDLAVVSPDCSILFLLAGRGDGTFEPALGFPSARGNHDLSVGDLNGDGRPDLVTSAIQVSGLTDGLSIFLNPASPAAGSPPIVTAPSDFSVTEGQAAAFTVTASDPDSPKIDKLFDDVDLSGRTFTVNAQNTSAAWSYPSSFGEGGITYTLVFTARNNLASAAITKLHVQALVSANAPVLAQPSDMTVNEGVIANQPLTATDADGDPLRFSIVSGPTFATVTTTSPGTGTATGNLRVAPGPTDAGAYAVTVRAADHALNDDKSLAITVNDSPGMPVLAPIANMTVCISHTADQAISATDPDADAITFTSSGPSFMTVTANAQVGTTRTGNIHLAPVFDFGGFQGTVTAVAGGLSHSRTFQIIVQQFCGAPVLAQPANMTVNEGATADQTLSGTDPNGTLLSFAKVSGPLFMTVTTTSVGTGSATGNVHLAPGFADAGSYTATVLMTDGSLSDAKSFSITVNQACPGTPRAVAGGPYTGFVGVPVAFDGSASSDPSGSPLTYSWDFGDGSSGTGATPQHTYTALGTFTVGLTVTGACGSASDATQAVIQDACLVSAFTSGGNRTVRLHSGRPTLCAQMEPATGCYRNEDVLLTTIVMQYSGGAVSEIHAVSDKTAIDTDTNSNGIGEITACFRKEDLRQLFSGLPNGTNNVTVMLQGDLSTGGRVRGSLDLRVVSSGGSAVAVAPNPFNPAGTLTFTTSRSGRAKVELFDVQGRLVRTILEDVALPAGTHDVRIDGGALPSGLYFLRGSSVEGRFQRSIVLLK